MLRTFRQETGVAGNVMRLLSLLHVCLHVKPKMWCHLASVHLLHLALLFLQEALPSAQFGVPIFPHNPAKY